MAKSAFGVSVRFSKEGDAAASQRGTESASRVGTLGREAPASRVVWLPRVSQAVLRCGGQGRQRRRAGSASLSSGCF